MTTTVAEPDWDTRTNAYLEQQVDDRRLEEILEDGECFFPDCTNLATFRGTAIPCFDIGNCCADHRERVMRVRAVMLQIYGFQNCGRCKQPVSDVLWERIT